MGEYIYFFYSPFAAARNFSGCEKMCSRPRSRNCSCKIRFLKFDKRSCSLQNRSRRRNRSLQTRNLTRVKIWRRRNLPHPDLICGSAKKSVDSDISVWYDIMGKCEILRRHDPPADPPARLWIFSQTTHKKKEDYLSSFSLRALSRAIFFAFASALLRAFSARSWSLMA